MKKIKLSSLFKREDTRFLISCGIKFSGIYLISAFFIYYIVWIMLSLNSIYFESKIEGFGPELRETFLLHSLGFFYEKLPQILSFFVLMFFAGAYVGKTLLRPFEIIGKYCLEKTNGESVNYNPDIFSDYKLLTRFSEYFFLYIDDIFKNKKFKTNTIPPHFSKIHSAPFERVFFFHFSLLVIMIAVVTGSFVIYISGEIRSNIMDLSLRMISAKDPTVGYFMNNQNYIYDSLLIVSCLIILLSYMGLSYHLYSRVSGAIYGFFSTMRAYMKGNYKSRIHLIGFGHIRPHGRSFNKYLDHIERECSIEHNVVDLEKQKSSNIKINKTKGNL